jgi:hypothetical protein
MGESFGRYLRREREMREIPLEQIANETKIKLGLLRALEADRIAELPSPAIVKGFLRSYARILGLSPHDLQLRYQSFLEEVAPERLTQQVLRQWVPARRRRLHPAGWLILAAIGIGLALRLSGGEAPRMPEKAAKPERPESVVYRKNYLRDLRSPSPAGSPAHVAAASPEWSGPREGGASILLRAIGPTSVLLTLDGGTPQTVALAPGQPVVRYAFREALIDQINPALLALEVNGEPLAPEEPLEGPARVTLRVLPPVPVEEGEPPEPPRVAIEAGIAPDEPLPPPAKLPLLEFPARAARKAGGTGEPAARRATKRVEVPPPVFAPASRRRAVPPEAARPPSPGSAPARPEGSEPPSEPEPGRDAGAASEPAPPLVPKSIPLPAAPPPPASAIPDENPPAEPSDSGAEGR